MLAQLLIRTGLLLPLLPPVADSPPPVSVFTPVRQQVDGQRLEVSPSPDNRPSAMIAAQAREIAQLRRNLAISPLSGTALAGEDDGSYASSGARQSTEREFAQALETVLGVGLTDVKATDAGEGADPAPGPEEELPDFLRQTSRELDDLANDCEARRDYPTADRLRATSQRLRDRARRMD